MFYRGLIIASFISESATMLKSFSIFDEKEGHSKIDLNQCYFRPKGRTMKTITHLRVPRLDWDHRDVSQDFSSSQGVLLPRKLLIAGEYDDD